MNVSRALLPLLRRDERVNLAPLDVEDLAQPLLDRAPGLYEPSATRRTSSGIGGGRGIVLGAGLGVVMWAGLIAGGTAIFRAIF